MVSSAIASGVNAIGIDFSSMNADGSNVLNSFGQDYMQAAMIAAGGVSGGISSTIAGGNFWDGLRQGIITSALNHVAHLAEAAEEEGGGPNDPNPNRASSDNTHVQRKLIERKPFKTIRHTKTLGEYEGIESVDWELWVLPEAKALFGGRFVFGAAAKGGSFAEKAFLSEGFGITSQRFANSLTGVKGTWNNQGGLFKMGWSNQSKYGGGMQFRIGIGSKVGNPNQAWKHIYVPKTFVPNSFANPSIQLKQSLFKLGF